MFDIKKSFDFDQKAAEEGVKMMLGADPEEYILICRLPNKKYTAKLTSVMQKHGKLLEYLKAQDSEAFADKDKELQAGVLAKTVIIGWGNKIALDGKVIKYSEKSCMKLIQDYPELRAACLEFATDVANYPVEVDIEDLAKK